MELPFIKFYGRDWLGDSQLRLCSLAARGLWIDLLALMASSQRRGYLEIGGKAVSDAVTISRIVCADVAEVGKMLSELEQAGVFSRGEAGTIYSRRMVRDAAVSEQKRMAGLQGGNPALVNHPVKRVLKQEDKQQVKRVLKPRDQRPETRDKACSTKARKLNSEQKELADKIEKLLGDEWPNDAGKWLNRITGGRGDDGKVIPAEPDRVRRVFNDTEQAINEGRVTTTPARYAWDTWGRFK